MVRLVGRLRFRFLLALILLVIRVDFTSCSRIQPKNRHANNPVRGDVTLTEVNEV